MKGSMAISSSALCLSICFLVCLNCCVASQQQQQQQQHQQPRDINECQIQNLDAQEPIIRVQSEGGATEIYDFNNQQLRCAGVAVARHTIDRSGLMMPALGSAPSLFYIVQGRGIQGVLIPGCPETYQSSQGSQGIQDLHQKIRRYRQGDILAVPAGIAYWLYNDGDTPIVAVELQDTSNNANQLDKNPRGFFLAGNPEQAQVQQLGQGSQQQQPGGQQGQGEQQGQGSQQQQQGGQQGQGQGQQSSGSNVLSGFDARLLAEAFGVDIETARKLQGLNDQRGHIVRVEGGLQVIRPPLSREEEQQQEQQQGQGGPGNGLEESLCNIRLRENIGSPSRADVYNPRAGRIRSINSNDLPILDTLQLSAEMGVLYRNGIMAPYYNLNAHSVTYAVRGRARFQVVDNHGQTVFDDELREGQLLVEPQNFAVIKQASEEGFEYVSFKTNDNAMIAPLAGRTSLIRGIPEDVLANAYQISRQDAKQLKNNRQETIIFAPSSRSERRAFA